MTEYRHVVCIALPAGNQVIVNVFFYPSSCGSAKVSSEVKSLGIHQFLKYPRGTIRQRHYFHFAVKGNIHRIGHVFIRCDHEMSVVIRIQIHHNETQFTPVKDQHFTIVTIGRLVAKNATVFLKLADVLNSPGSPKSFHA